MTISKPWQYALTAAAGLFCLGMGTNAWIAVAVYFLWWVGPSTAISNADARNDPQPTAAR
jgi:hypothetical protein